MCKVSVIVPVYNVEKYLPECIDSLLKQTFEDVEFIFVNDGSTDLSSNILEKYKELDQRIIIINKTILRLMLLLTYFQLNFQSGCRRLFLYFRGRQLS